MAPEASNLLKINLEISDFWELMTQDARRISVVVSVVNQIVRDLDPKKVVPFRHVGSTYMRNSSQGQFFTALSHLTKEGAYDVLLSSDYDFSLKLDTFFLEALLEKLPNLVKSQEYAEYPIGGERLLKEAYTTTVGELYKVFPDIFKNVIHEHSVYSKNEAKLYNKLLTDKDFLNQKVQFLFVKNFNAVDTVWRYIPKETFALYYWKRSPFFIGESALKATFKIFEEFAVNLNFGISKKVLSKSSLLGQAPVPLQDNAVDFELVLPVPEGQAVGAAW